MADEKKKPSLWEAITASSPKPATSPNALPGGTKSWSDQINIRRQKNQEQK